MGWLYEMPDHCDAVNVTAVVRASPIRGVARSAAAPFPLPRHSRCPQRCRAIPAARSIAAHSRYSLARDDARSMAAHSHSRSQKIGWCVRLPHRPTRSLSRGLHAQWRRRRRWMRSLSSRTCTTWTRSSISSSPPYAPPSAQTRPCSS
eukprot:1970454-Prymnesium_polylepis.1